MGIDTSVVQRVNDHKVVVAGIVVSCASIDAALEGLYRDMEFNPDIIVFSRTDHDAVLEEVKADHIERGLLTSGKVNLSPKLGSYENLTTHTAMYVFIRDIPQGTIHLYSMK